MNALFVDAQFWIARFHPGDQWHDRAREVEATVEGRPMVTSEAVLVEFLNFFSTFRPAIRREAAHVAAEVHEASAIDVVESSSQLFWQAHRLYRQRLDKTYSMVDCMSMVIMRDRDIQEVLTNDDHFAQEGFTILLGDDNLE
ncbi:putative nucleic acid-binding protein [Salinibacter ruber]|uniref:type II toxin-antitoxin system VapC family toxin n=1 Tax=Salinibacter ruber TaxID=146919 RepID=UPI0021682957|nr:PIN domain-containing protein [Salinibacter ruber]MCS4034694.1 putative nucleic acid-binding protein [Salinibacter ruber]